MSLSENQQSKIKQLRESYKSTDSIPFIDALEKDLSTLQDSKSILKLPAFLKWADAASKAMNEITALLQNDESLLNDEGKRLFKQREIYRQIFKTFSIEHVDQAIVSLEQTIDEKLASNKQNHG